MARRFAFTLVAALVASGSVAVSAWGQSGTGPLSVEDRSVGQKERGQQQNEQDGRDEAVMMLMQELDRYQRETRELRNLVEQLQHRLETMKEAQRERYLDLDTRLNALAEASTRPQAGDGSSDAGGSDQQESGEQPDPEKDRKAYQAAKGELLKRNFQAAARAFRSYLDDFPDGGFRPYAHFWLGEVYRNLGERDDDAREQFRKVVEQYPDHSKTPAALYKLASLEADAGNTGKARVTLEKLRMKFPDSREAELASGMLEQLKADADG